MSIIVDPEFKNLIPPLSEDEFKQLEENCVKDGIRDPLVVWPQGDGNDILIDGHNRWEISAKHAGIQFQIKRKDFESRADVIAWIIKNQFGRRNLSAYDRSVLALKLKPLIAEKAKEKQSEGGGAVRQKSDKAVIDTKKELAKVAGVSHDTIHKVERIEEKATEGIKNLVKQGKLSINQAYNSTFPKRPDPVKEAKQEHEDFQKKKEEAVVNFADIQRDKQNQRILNNELTQDILKLISTVNAFGFRHKTSEIEKLTEELTEDYKKDLIDRLTTCNKVIYKIQTALTWKEK